MVDQPHLAAAARPREALKRDDDQRFPDGCRLLTTAAFGRPRNGGTTEPGWLRHDPVSVNWPLARRQIHSDLVTRPLRGRCRRCEAQPMRSASETMIPSGPRT
jgi:hypothetical protein